MNSVPCSIVLLPNSDIAQKAITVSQQLAQLDSLFTLKDGEYFPHASLYMTQLKVADLDSVKERLAAIAGQVSPFDLTAVRYYQTQGFIDVEYQRTSTLDDLQMKVVGAINPIRDGMHEKDKVRMQTATGRARENFEKYGYPNIGELFRPHVTLTRFPEVEPKDGLELPPIETFSGRFTKLGLFEMGNNGTCVRKIAEFEL
jgi:hypothetical protein